jgi:hypothetical protein
MSNSDLLNQADSVLRPVLRKLTGIPWIRVTGCCAGHQPEDSVWFELQVRGTSGISSLMEWLRVLNSKLAGTECRTDCLVNYGGDSTNSEIPHGWFPITIETFCPSGDDWRRGQALIVEAVLSSVEELGDKLEAGFKSEGALNYCPFCSSSFIRLESFEADGHRYCCGDCETAWTMLDPKL